MNAKPSEVEFELAALAQRYQDLIRDAKRVHTHLKNCPHGDMETYTAFESILLHCGIRDKVMEATEQPKDYPADFDF